MWFLKSDPGTYALILQSYSEARIQIGQRHQMDLKLGYYIYVGSALGPGGLKARLSRHFRKSKPHHWHIDYLREFVNPMEVWYSFSPERFEHRWAQALFEMNGLHHIQGFGSTDCKCFSHLFWTPTVPDFGRFSRTVGGDVLSFPCPVACQLL
ncbi:MAG: hypothetical protein COX19_15665 [Desulfobacterales bacterium CG23_combo_of_CG06-09_8_20_14_all_51_8]|nr:MAG: hypothetical protein COX19_15665 [Desulfobacterales bacterium CG23_combo_of_CG06-09_8_20_14_all_51_8]